MSDCCNVDVSPPSSARVKIVQAKNATFSEAYQFDDETVTQWDFLSKTFSMSIKGNYEQAAALLTLTSGAGQIVVDDTTKRILHFNVPMATLQAALVPGSYIYDLIMTDAASVRTQLMHGEFVFTDAITP